MAGEINLEELSKAIAGVVPAPYGPLASMGAVLLFSLIQQASGNATPVSPGNPTPVTSDVGAGLDKIAASIQRLATAVEAMKK